MKPIPQTQLAPNICHQLVPAGLVAIPIFSATQENAVIPKGLPSRRPNATPMATRLVAAARRFPMTGTPALESAKSGMTTKLTQGWRVCSMRCKGSLYAFAEVFHRVDRGVRFIRIRLGCIEAIDEPGHSELEVWLVDLALARDGERHENAGDGGVDTGVHEEEPDREPYAGVDRGSADAAQFARAATARPMPPKTRKLKWSWSV